MTAALAEVNYGRWIAECPAPGCHDARGLLLDGRLDSTIMCANGHVSPVTWPGDLASVLTISNALNKRVEDFDKAWIPSGSKRALAGFGPVDQTPAELDEETAMLADRASAEATKQTQVLGWLADLGLTLQPDGTIAGVVDLAAISGASTATSEDTP